MSINRCSVDNKLPIAGAAYHAVCTQVAGQHVMSKTPRYGRVRYFHCYKSSQSTVKTQSFGLKTLLMEVYIKVTVQYISRLRCMYHVISGEKRASTGIYLTTRTGAILFPIPICNISKASKYLSKIINMVMF